MRAAWYLAPALAQEPLPPVGAVRATPPLVPIVLAILAFVIVVLWLARRTMGLRGSSGATRKRADAAEREAAFMEMTVAMHQARRQRESAPGGEAAPARTAPAFTGTVHCPACAAPLGAAGPLLRYVTRCPSCGRRVTAQVDGARVIVEVEEG